MRALAASVLGYNEKETFGSVVHKLYKDNKDLQLSGTLLYTSEHRVIFVAEQGIFNKKYDIHHWYNINQLTNCRVEKRLLGNALAIDVTSIEGPIKYRYEGIPDAPNWVQNLTIYMGWAHLTEEIVRLINSKERTKFFEIQPMLQKCFTDCSPQAIIRYLQGLLAKKRIDGFIDESTQEFVHMNAYKQRTEVIQYNIVANFSFNSNGALEVKCPHCNGSQELSQKHQTMNCQYCGKGYVIPEKILNML